MSTPHCYVCGRWDGSHSGGCPNSGQVYKPVGPCPCECNRGGFCGGCGHAGCSGGINTLTVSEANARRFVEGRSLDYSAAQRSWHYTGSVDPDHCTVCLMGMGVSHGRAEYE